MLIMGGMRIKKDWYNYTKGRMLCVKHNQLFHVGSSCELCNSISESPQTHKQGLTNYPQITPYKKVPQETKPIGNKGYSYIDKNTQNNPPLKGMENKKSKKGALSNQPNDRTGLSKRKIEAYLMYKKGSSYKTISIKLKCSKSTAYEYVKKGISLYKADKGVILPNDKPLPNARTYKGDIRLHNDSVSFLINPIDLSMEKDCIKLKYDRYKLIKLENQHIQVFSKKLVVRFLNDIWADNINDAKHQADERIRQFWADFEFKGITLLNDKCEIVSRHYAIINTDLAKHFIKEKKRLIILNPNDKGVRASIDFSHKTPEFEFENKDLNDKDVPIWRTLIKDSLENPIDTLSITKKKTDLLIQDFIESKKMILAYTEQIKLHLEVMQQMKDTLKKIEEKLK